MRGGHVVSRWRVAGAAFLGLLLPGANAFGSFGAHYLGTSRDHSEFRLYLDGGEFLGQSGSVQSIRVAVHQLRSGRLNESAGDCVYRFDVLDRSKDRIECAPRAGSYLSGAVYVRDMTQDAKLASEAQPMVCVKRCNARAPLHLKLEDAEQDNH